MLSYDFTVFKTTSFPAALVLEGAKGLHKEKTPGVLRHAGREGIEMTLTETVRAQTRQAVAELLAAAGCAREIFLSSAVRPARSWASALGAAPAWRPRKLCGKAPRPACGKWIVSGRAVL